MVNAALQEAKARRAPTLRAEVYQEIGPRGYQQDAYSIAPVSDGLLAAVFDGHYPEAEHLVRALVRELPSDFERAFEQVAPRSHDLPQERRVLRKTVARLMRRHRYEEAGATATLAWVHGVDTEKVLVHIAVLGDSPAAVWDGCRLRVPRLHSPAHHPDRQRLQEKIDALLEDEQTRLAYAGARVDESYVWRNREVGLAVTRAIGDADFGDLLVRRPEIYSYHVAIDSGVIVLGSDGVLTNVSPAAVKRRMGGIVQGLREGQSLSEVLGQLEPARDNRTAVVLRLGAP